MRGEPIRFANVAGEHVGDGSTAVSLADYIASQMDPGLTWRDAEWLRSIWDGPIVIKGIQTVADARIAADEGIDAIALSNHGGRQLDSAPAIVDLVAPVADAVGDRIEIICDGGVRRGSDIVKARRPRGPRVHGRARVPLRARRGGGARASTTCCSCSTPTCAGSWRSSAPTTSPRSPATGVRPDAALTRPEISSRRM